MAIHGGECFCGALKIEVTGEPQAMGYCTVGRADRGPEGQSMPSPSGNRRT